MSARKGDDEGSLIPLIAFYFLVAATLILVVVDASKFYLATRSLQSAADGAALASAQSVSTPSLYAGRGLLLNGDLCTAVEDYGTANDLADRFDALSMVAYPDNSVGTCQAAGAAEVTVVARDQVQLPLVGIFGAVDPRFDHGVTLTVTAHAALRCATC